MSHSLLYDVIFPLPCVTFPLLCDVTFPLLCDKVTRWGGGGGCSHHPTAFTPIRTRNRVWCANGGQTPTDTQKPAAIGSETLSKRGNKVWVSTSLPGVRRVSSDRGWKKRRRNKVWVSLPAGTSTTPGQKRVIDEQGGGLRQQDFVVDKGGKRMRRLSSAPCVPSTPLIKRALARLKGLQWHLRYNSLCFFLSVCVCVCVCVCVRVCVCVCVSTSRVVRKSLAHVWHARRQAHLNPDSSQQCCTFYNRFGNVGF